MSDATLAIALDRLVRRIHVDLSQKAKRFDQANVGPGGAMLLLTLDEMGPQPMNAIARRLVRDKSQLTREIGSLERKGMVARTPCDNDGRVSLLSLTQAGQDLVTTHQRELSATLDVLLSPLSETERQTLTHLLSAVKTNDA